MSRLRFVYKILHDFVMVRSQVRQSKPQTPKSTNAIFHAVAAHDGAVKGEQVFRDK